MAGTVFDSQGSQGLVDLGDDFGIKFFGDIAGLDMTYLDEIGSAGGEFLGYGQSMMYAVFAYRLAAVFWTVDVFFHYGGLGIGDVYGILDGFLKFGLICDLVDGATAGSVGRLHDKREVERLESLGIEFGRHLKEAWYRNAASFESFTHGELVGALLRDGSRVSGEAHFLCHVVYADYGEVGAAGGHAVYLLFLADLQDLFFLGYADRMEDIRGLLAYVSAFPSEDMSLQSHFLSF